MVKELFRLARVNQQDRKLPGFRLQQWYFFFVAVFYLYLRCGERDTLWCDVLMRQLPVLPVLVL